MIEKEFEKKHIQELIRYNGKIERIFEHTSKDLARVIRQYEVSQGIKGVTTEKIRKGYTWARNRALQRKVDEVLEKLHKNIQVNIQDGMITQWDLANIKNNGMVEAWWKGLGLVKVDIPTAFQQLNLAALDTFLARTEARMNLSKRVWNLTNGAKDQLETYLASGITTGKSAVRISKEVEQFMSGKGIPYKGILIKARNIKFETIRLAATEMNMAYRMSDYTRRQQLPFITGIEVHLSASHPRPDMCDSLVGRYPKGFIFTGWHPLCICYSTSIMLNKKDSLEFMRTGKIAKSKYVTTIPKSAQGWVDKNAAKIAGWKNRPYWINDNFTKDFKLKKKITEVIMPEFKIPEPIKPEFVPANEVRTNIVKSGDKIQKEIDELWKEYSRVSNLFIKACNRNDYALASKYEKLGLEFSKKALRKKKSLATILRKKLYVDKFGFGMQTEIKGKGSYKVIENGIKNFTRLVDQKIIDTKYIEVTKGYKGLRAFYKDGRIYIAADDKERMVIHELGHWLEDKNPEIHRKILAFYDERTKDEKARWLGGGFGKSEISKKDKFIDPYMGKYYAGKYTEILSMGLEYFYKDPYALAKKDPEYFDFIYNLVRGM